MHMCNYYQGPSPSTPSGTEDRSTMLGTSCWGGDDDGRVVGGGGERERREGAGGGVVPDCDKSMRGVEHHYKTIHQYRAGYPICISMHNDCTACSVYAVN